MDTAGVTWGAASRLERGKFDMRNNGHHRPPHFTIPSPTTLNHTIPHFTTLHIPHFTTLHHTNGMIQRYMMMPSPTHCSVEKPHNSSKKILFPEKTTRSANTIRFHCRSRTISHCIKGKAFLKTRHMSRPGILLDRNHDVGSRKKSFIKSKSVTQISHCGVQLSQHTHTMHTLIQ